MSPHAKLASLAGPTLRMQPDARLARLAREGSVQAFEEIVRRYRPRLVAFAAGIVPPHRAEDIVQESLERVFTALRESTTEVHLKPWLYTIVRNRSLNAVRDERVHVGLDEEHDGVTPPPEIVARREEVAALVAGIQALPEAQRQALVGRELEGLSHDQIAAQLGTSPGSVRGLIFRARTAVRHAAGALVPLPLIRWLLAEAAATPGAADAVAGAGLAAAGAGAGVAAAGGGGLGVKAGTVLLAGILAAGAGIGLNRGGSSAGQDGDAHAAPLEDRGGDRGVRDSKGSDGGGSDPPAGQDAGGDEDRDHGPRDGNGDRRDDEGHEPDDDGDGEDDESSGPGSGGRAGSAGHSGPGDDDGGHSGPGGGDDDPEPPDDDDSSGPGGGDDDPEPADDDSSGSGDGDDEAEIDD